ncbi:uncharacterized protein [Eurosta solidaginis]|uniref:uncharacterized protein isoform X3 n=1 Tax=Eurosta solidaginis TaxID=178769 RepID=UPI003530CE9B
MRVVAMVSGGKDSCYNMMQCVAEGHEIVALANLHPKDRDELDSFMYQTVGHMGIEILAEAMGLPLYRQETKGKSKQTGKHYVPTDDDEVEDLYSLLELCKNELKVEAVAVGAILSDYQRVRVENVCSRLNLVSLAYLWRRDQSELLQEMIDCQVHAIIIKVAALGLVPDRHLGKSLREIQPHLIKMRDKYGLNVCGEGGEYETFTLDCLLFKQRIVVEDVQTIISSADPICPVGYINFTKLSLQPKEANQCCDVFVKKSLDYISDLNESTYSDLSDPDLSETELELIEKETRLRESLSQNELIISRSNSFGRHVTTSSSPIPIVTKSASVDEPKSPSSLLSSAALCGASLHAASHSFDVQRPLGSSTAAVHGSLSLEATTGILVTQPPSPIKFEREFRALKNQPMAACNQKGWMWVAGIQGCAPTLEKGMQLAMKTLIDLAADHNYEITDYCYVTLYISSMAEYPLINHIYGQTINFHNPPTRVCVECPLPEDCHVILEAIAFRTPMRRCPTISTNELDGSIDDHNISNDLPKQRQTMHVQGISHWAPANIGTYSQSTRIDEITYISGQIGLVPGSMTIIEGGIRPQCKLALRHVSRIAKAMNAQGQLRDVVHGICFLTHPAFITEARRQWERRTANAIMDYIVVPTLPRDALVEWQVWAHTHNDQFESAVNHLHDFDVLATKRAVVPTAKRLRGLEYTRARYACRKRRLKYKIDSSIRGESCFINSRGSGDPELLMDLGGGRAVWARRSQVVITNRSRDGRAWCRNVPDLHPAKDHQHRYHSPRPSGSVLIAATTTTCQLKIQWRTKLCSTYSFQCKPRSPYPMLSPAGIAVLSTNRRKGGSCRFLLKMHRIPSKSTTGISFF